MSATPDSVVPLDRASRLYGRKIQKAWQKSVEGILEAGSLLLQAKADLRHGEFERMVRESCPFGKRTAQMLMKIASHPVLADAQHISHLPASWGTLAELAKFEPKELSHALRNYWVKPETKREEVGEIRRRTQKAIGLEPTARSTAPSKPKGFQQHLRSTIERNTLEWLSGLGSRDAKRIAQRVSAFLEELREEMADGT